MSDHVDLNHKVWGFKARNHIILFFVLEMFFSLLMLAALIDYMNLPSKPPKGVEGMVIEYITHVPVSLAIFGCILCSALGCQNRIVYGIMSIILIFGGLWLGLQLILGLTSVAIFGSNDSESWKNKKKYYKLAIPASYASETGGALVRLYLGAVLFNLSFLYPSKPPVIVVVEAPRKRKSSRNSGNSGTGTGGESGPEEE